MAVEGVLLEPLGAGVGVRSRFSALILYHYRSVSATPLALLLLLHYLLLSEAG